MTRALSGIRVIDMTSTGTRQVLTERGYPPADDIDNIAGPADEPTPGWCHLLPVEDDGRLRMGRHAVANALLVL